MKKIIYTLGFLTILVSNLLSPAFSLATIGNPILDQPFAPSDTPKAYFNSMLNVVITLFLIVGVLYFMVHGMFAGFHLMTTEGEIKKYEEARHELTWSIMGLLIVFSVFAIIKIVGTIFGITGLDGLQIQWPTI